MVLNTEFQHKDLLLYLGNRVQYLDSKKERWIALKQVYNL